MPPGRQKYRLCRENVAIEVLKPVFSQLDPRLRQFRHAGYAVSF